MATWREAHPAWGYRLWREADIEGFGLRNEPLWRDLIERGIYDAASDVARIEVLHRHGGIYIDADSQALRPMDGAPFLDARFFATREIRPGGHTFVTNAFMGSVPGHDILVRYIDRIGKRRVVCGHRGKAGAFCCAWKQTGPVALTQMIKRTDAVILEPWAFFTHTIMGDPVPGHGWGEHYWSSTTTRSPAGTFPGGRGYA